MNSLLDGQTLLFSFVLINALACLLLKCLQSVLIRQRATKDVDVSSTRNFVRGQIDDRPFFSVHVPTHNEPPEIVIATLEHLAGLNWHRYEVIVVDNNTQDPKLWRPIETACARLGPKFRFYHRENVQGAKAGALNIAAELTTTEATHFAIVDADYQVTPDFLSAAAQALDQTRADFVQFPQAYRDQSRAPIVAMELSDYFLNVAHHTNRAQAMLLTGTLSVISRAAFNAVGGWSRSTITEDAELGVRLLLGHYRGVYVPKTVGRGMLPLDFSGLAKQRDRWVAGNMQTLIGAIKAGILPVHKPALAIWSQLTAWVSLGIIPAFALLILAFFPSSHFLSASTATLAGLTILLSISSLPFSWRFSDTKQHLGFLNWLRVCRVKIALLWTSSSAWLPVLFGTELTFQRTPKSVQATAGFFLPWVALTSAIFGLVCIIYFIDGQIIAGISSLILASSWFAARSVDQELCGIHQAGHEGERVCGA